jgi:hypothetical protein
MKVKQRYGIALLLCLTVVGLLRISSIEKRVEGFNNHKES